MITDGSIEAVRKLLEENTALKPLISILYRAINGGCVWEKGKDLVEAENALDTAVAATNWEPTEKNMNHAKGEQP